MNTDELITTLSTEKVSKTPLASPKNLWTLSLVFFTIYGAIITLTLGGLRGDVLTFLSQPLVQLEMVLMLGLLASSLHSSIHLIFPDQYQQPLFEALPWLLLTLLFIVLGVQMGQVNLAQLSANIPQHMECLSCIAIATILPAAALFILTQKGASTTPLKSGCCALLAASTISAIALRLVEPTNDIAHLLLSHYLPIMLFAALGVLLGRALLKW